MRICVSRSAYFVNPSNSRLRRASARESGRMSATAMDAEGASAPSASSVIDFLHLMQNLKTIPRTGWVRRGVASPESIADHMYRMSCMALACMDNPEVDHVHCMKLAIVHDMAESIVGDIAPDDGVSAEEKHARERAAIETIRNMLGPQTGVARAVEALWLEYEEGGSDAAKLVKDFDKLEMILQAYEYEKQQGVPLQEFFDSTAGKFKTQTGRAWAAEVLRRRNSLNPM